MNKPSFEENYLNILQNIEAAIIREYKYQPGLGDLQVDTGIEALIQTYRAEQVNKQAKLILSNPAMQVYLAVKKVTDWRLGRVGYENDEGHLIDIDNPLTLDEMTSCLKRIRKSIQTWNKRNGSQGYLNYISMFIR
jgi:hypothetical protein